MDFFPGLFTSKPNAIIPDSSRGIDKVLSNQTQINEIFEQLAQSPSWIYNNQEAVGQFIVKLLQSNQKESYLNKISQVFQKSETFQTIIKNKIDPKEFIKAFKSQLNGEVLRNDELMVFVLRLCLQENNIAEYKNILLKLSQHKNLKSGISVSDDPLVVTLKLMHSFSTDESEKKLLFMTLIIKLIESGSHNDQKSLDLAIEANDSFTTALLLKRGMIPSDDLKTKAAPEMRALIENLTQVVNDKTMDARGLSNLVGDAFITKMTLHGESKALEGQSMTKGLSVVTLLVDKVKREIPNDLVATNKINEISNRLKDALWLARLIDVTGSSKEGQQFISLMMRDKVEQMNKGDSIVLPFGWKGVEGGHAMVCEIKCTDKGSFDMNVINTGDGVEFSPSYKPGEVKQKTPPFIKYEKMPIELITNSQFLDALVELKSTLPEKARDYKGIDIYKGVLKRFKGYQVKNIDPHIVSYITGQRSGTCSVRCWMAYLHTTLGDTSYKLIKNLMEVEGNLTFLEHYGKTLPSDPRMREVLRRSAENLARQNIKLKELLSERALHAPQLILDEVKKATPATADHKLLNIHSGLVEKTNQLSNHLRDLASKIQVNPTPKPYAPNSLNIQLPPGSKINGSDPEAIMNYLHQLRKWADSNPAVSAECLLTGLVQGVLALEAPKLGGEDVWSKMYDEESRWCIDVFLTLAGRITSLVGYPPLSTYDKLVAIHLIYGISCKLTKKVDPAMAKFNFEYKQLIDLKENELNTPFYPLAESKLAETVEYFSQTEIPPLEKNILFHFDGLVTTRFKESSADYQVLEAMYAEIASNASILKQISQTVKENDPWFKLSSHSMYHTESEGLNIFLKPGHHTASTELRIILAELWTKQYAITYKGYHKLRDIALLSYYSAYRTKEFSNGYKPNKSLMSPRFEYYVDMDVCYKFRWKIGDQAHFMHEFIAEEENELAKLFPNDPKKTIEELRKGLTSVEENQYCAFTPFKDRYKQQISQKSNLTIPHLISHYKNNIQQLEQPNELYFFNQALFSKNALHDLIENDPIIIPELFHFIDHALTELDLKLASKGSASTENLEKTAQASINMLFVRAQILTYLDFHKTISPQKIEQERLNLETMINGLLEGKNNQVIFKNIKQREQLLAVKILLKAGQQTWNLNNVSEFLTTLFQVSLSKTDQINALLPHLIQQISHLHIQEMKHVMKDPVDAAKICSAIVSSFQLIPAQSQISWLGTYPIFEGVYNGVQLRLNMLDSSILVDGVPLVHPKEFYASSAFQNIFKDRKPTSVIPQYVDNQKTFYHVKEDQDQYRFLFQQSNCLSTEKLIDGQWSTLLEPQNHPPGITLPKQPNDSHYLYWFVPGTEKIMIEDKQTRTRIMEINKDGSVVYGNDKKPRTVLSLIGSSLVDFENMNFIGAYKQNDEVFYEFTRYRDRTGKMISFEYKDVEVKKNSMEIPIREFKNVWKENPEYFLAGEQKLNDVDPFTNYLIVENKKGVKKALIPNKPISDSKLPAQQSFECELINIRAGSFVPMGIKQNLLLAYHFLNCKKYEDALICLKNAKSTKAYSPEELKLLGWIFVQESETSQMTPEDKALRLYCASLVEENQNLYLTSPKIKKNDLEEPVNHNSTPAQWQEFWLGNTLFENKTKNQKLVEDYENYLRIRNNLPDHMKLDKALLTPYEEVEWLSKLVTLFPANYSLRNRFLALNKISLTETLPSKTEPLKNEFKIPSLSWPEKRLTVDQVINQPRMRSQTMLDEDFGPLFTLVSEASMEDKLKLERFFSDSAQELGPDYRSTQLAEYRGFRWLLLAVCQRDPSKPNEVENRIYEELIRLKYARAKGQDVKRHYLETLVTQYCNKIEPTATEPKPKDVSPKMEDFLPDIHHIKTEPLALNLKDDSLNVSLELFESYFLKEQKSIPRTYALGSISEELQTKHYKKRHIERINDLKEGIAQNDAQMNLKFKADGNLNELNSSLDKKIKEKEVILHQTKARYESLAVKMPDDPKKLREVRLKLMGLQYRHPSFAELTSLFVLNDKQQYRKRLPYHSEEDIIQLHQALGEYLQKSTTLQILQRAHEFSTKALRQQAKGSVKLEKTLSLIGAELNKKREYDPNKWPSFLVFEHHSNLTLRKEQSEALAMMLTKNEKGAYPNIILQMIMAAGKTRVLGTLLALNKADGYHLSLLIPPASLFDTNAQDMKVRSMAYFGQKANILQFNRSSEHFEVAYLKRIKHLLYQTISDRNFLICPPQTIQSMENKYIEARIEIQKLQSRLSTASKSEKEGILKEISGLERPTGELKEILHLLKTRGAATYDEVDVIFNPKVELNFPVNERKPLDLPSCELVGEVFYLSATHPEIKKLGLDILNNTQAGFLNENYGKVQEILAKDILLVIKNNPRLFNSLGFTPETWQKESVDLLKYLLNPTENPPEWLDKRHSSKDSNQFLAAERIILLRQEILKWLPRDWHRSADEHYMRSHNPQVEIAKPTLAANVPNEKALIGDTYEMINKTLHLYIHNGLDTTQTKRLVEQIREIARLQWMENPKGQMIEHTPAAQEFHKVFKGINLFKVDLDNPEEFKSVFDIVNNQNPDSLRYIIQYLITGLFPTVETFTRQITNSCHNLASALGGSMQGYSGTPDNPYIFPHGLQVSEKGKPIDKAKGTIVLDVGTNGRIVDLLLRENNTVQTGNSTQIKTAEDFLHHLLDKRSLESKKRAHAIIDIGAYFKGQNNAKVAQDILNYYNTFKETTVKGVLYFDEERNTLVCLKKGHEEKPIYLSDTDPATIRSMTGLKSAELFTYYDQRHITGTDIPQVPNAMALTTIGANDNLRNVLQGCMRMRQLFMEQNVEFVIPHEIIPFMESQIGPIKQPISVKDIINFTEKNASRAEEDEENIRVAFHKLHNTVRSFVLSKLYTAKTPEDEAILFNQTQTLFSRELIQKLYDSYAREPKMVPASEVLSQTVNSLLVLLTSLKNRVSAEELKNIKQELEEITKEALSHIPNELSQKIADDTHDTSVEMETEQEQTKEMRQEVETQIEMQVEQQQNLKHAQEIPWKFDNAKEVAEALTPKPYPVRNSAQPTLWQLKDVISGEIRPSFERCFDESVLISNNFVQTLEKQANLVDRYAKDMHETLIFRDPTTKKLKIAILTIAECSAFKDRLKSGGIQPVEMSIVQPSGLIVSQGNLHLDPEEKKLYQNLLLQALFFAGDVQELGRQPWKEALKQWSATEKTLKRTLFEMICINKNQTKFYKESAVEQILNEADKNDTVASPYESLLFAINKARIWIKS